MNSPTGRSEAPGESRRPAVGGAEAQPAIGPATSIDQFDLVCLATRVEAACLRVMDGIAPGGGPKDRGVRGAKCVGRRRRLKVRIWPRLKHVVAMVMVVVTIRRLLSDGGARKADCQSGRSDKGFDHRQAFPF